MSHHLFNHSRKDIWVVSSMENIIKEAPINIYKQILIVDIYFYIPKHRIVGSYSKYIFNSIKITKLIIYQTDF